MAGMDEHGPSWWRYSHRTNPRATRWTILRAGAIGAGVVALIGLTLLGTDWRVLAAATLIGSAVAFVEWCDYRC
jgi:hypothetical protein